MTIRTNVKAGNIKFTHNERPIHDNKRATGVKVKTHIKAGQASKIGRNPATG